MRAALGVVGLLWLGAAVLHGCAAKTEGEEERPVSSNVPVALQVENHGWSDVVIYLVRGTASERLGTVGGLNTAIFTFPFQKLGTGSVQLRADPIGGDAAFTSEDLRLQPGQSIKWTLEGDLKRSFLGVY